VFLTAIPPYRDKYVWRRLPPGFRDRKTAQRVVENLPSTHSTDCGDSLGHVHFGGNQGSDL